MQEWLRGERRPPPGIRAELAVRLRQRAAEALAVAASLEAAVSGLHGLTRRELAMIGWLLETPLLDETATSITAEMLRRRVETALIEETDARRMHLDVGEANRLTLALGRLTDAEATEVLAASRDAHDLDLSLPDD